MKNTLYVCLLLSFLSVGSYAQSPWVNPKGSFYGQVSGTYLGYSSVINDELNQIVPVDFSTQDITTSLYADYSLSDKFAVIANLPFKSVLHNEQRLSGLGDPNLKVKYQILKKIPLAAYVGYTAPFSKRNGVLRTGYNQHAAELGLSVGKGNEKYFVYGGLGLRYRANIPNQVLLEFEYGYQFSLAKKPLYVIFRVDGMLNTSSVIDAEAGQANLYHNNGEFISPAVKFAYNAFNNVWINAAVHSAVFVKNFGASSTFNVGFAYKLTR